MTHKLDYRMHKNILIIVVDSNMVWVGQIEIDVYLKERKKLLELLNSFFCHNKLFFFFIKIVEFDSVFSLSIF